MELSKKEIYILGGILIAIITIIMAYYFVFLPGQRLAFEQQKYATEQLKETLRKAKYNDCVDLAYEDYVEDWNLNCENRGEEKNCSLPRILSEPLNKDLQEAKNKTCVVVSENI